MLNYLKSFLNIMCFLISPVCIIEAFGMNHSVIKDLLIEKSHDFLRNIITKYQ